MLEKKRENQSGLAEAPPLITGTASACASAFARPAPMRAA
jgi:hypothetical protein